MGRLPILSFALSFFFYNASLGIMTPFLQLFLKGKRIMSGSIPLVAFRSAASGVNVTLRLSP